MTKRSVRRALVALLSVMALAPGLAPATAQVSQGAWWITEPEPDAAENQGFIPYYEIGPRLREIETSSNRVKVEVIGQSVEGRNLFLVTVSDPQTMGRLGHYKALRNLMLRDPERAQQMAAQFEDFKVPFYVHGSIHGNEWPGVDASIELIERLAFENDPETKMVLDNTILLFNVVANPDGRVAGRRTNSNGFDLNRDFITQSQPETQAAVKVITEWNPMVTLDLHGFVNPMLIEPCTPPHNNNYEYDLYIRWALDQAKAMEQELADQLGFSAQIPFRDFPEAWDDWPPVYTPMYAMYHGSYGHTLETPFRDERGTAAHVAAVWGALKFASENRMGMIQDQIEIFRRGFLDMDQVSIADEHGEVHDFIAEFPRAHVIPVGEGQRSDAEAANLVRFLLANDVQVERATGPVTVGGEIYAAGSYVVYMDQPKRGLANTILGPGWDISDVVSRLYSAPGAWSLGYLWGADVVTAERDQAFDAKTVAVNTASAKGGVDAGQSAAYALEVDSPTAVRAVNALQSEGLSLELATEPVDSSGGTLAPGTVLIPSGAKNRLNQLAQEGLRFRAVASLPEREALEPVRIAGRVSDLELWVLRELGFDIDQVTGGQIASGAVDLAEYDVLLVTLTNFWNQLGTAGRAAVQAFWEDGGGFVGIRAGGGQVASSSGHFPVSWISRSGTGMARLSYEQDSPVVGAYPPEDTAQVETPTWFTSVPAGASVDARFLDEDFFVAGHWQDRSGAAGQPLVVRGNGTFGDARVVLFGIDPLFRAHPQRTFPAVASSVYWTSAG
ncbi:MAG TPA: M14 family zinc carboxypeptidase [Actinomycetota bacterium]